MIVKNICGWTPLHFGCESGHLAVVSRLVELENVAQNVKDNYRKTPLHLVCEKGHLELINCLAESGVYLNVKDNRFIESVKASKKLSPSDEELLKEAIAKVKQEL